MTENRETVNIYLVDKEKQDKVLKDASPHEKYIILQNDTLQVDIREHLLAIQKLHNRVEELEDTEERAETRISNIKGLLKNFHEMDKCRQELERNQREIIVNSNADMKSFRWRATRHLRILEAVLLLFLAVCFEFFAFTNLLPTLMCIMTVVSFQESTLYNLPALQYKEQENKIEELETDIKKTINAQDYIHEFLDQQ